MAAAPPDGRLARRVLRRLRVDPGRISDNPHVVLAYEGLSNGQLLEEFVRVALGPTHLLPTEPSLDDIAFVRIMLEDWPCLLDGFAPESLEILRNVGVLPLPCID